MNYEDVIEMMEEMKEEGVPKNVSEEIDQIIECLKSTTEDSTKINKVLSILDEVANDANLAPHARTQFWNVSSMLEGQAN